MATKATTKASKTSKFRNINWTYYTVNTITKVYMLGALAISFSHIIFTAGALGVTGWQKLTVPAFIDGFAVLGMIGRSAKFAEATQRTGFRLQAGAGALSFLCNVSAGIIHRNIGEMLYGALVVVGFVVAEWYGAKLVKAPVVNTRSEAAKRAAVTRKANAAKAERKAKEETRVLNRMMKAQAA